MGDTVKGDLKSAIQIVLKQQGLVNITESQYFQLECIVTGKNSFHQLPTGSGKTWPAISAPQVLDVLRDKYKHTHIPMKTRVLYIVPLLAIITTLREELAKLGIEFQVLETGDQGNIKSDSKVVIVTPERLVSRQTLSVIEQFSWSSIVIDEPHYMIMWGTSKKKNGVLKRPFRDAFQKLNQLNSLGAPFELHTATGKDLDKLFTLLGRKNSVWLKQIVPPERENLTYYLVDGKNVSDIKQFDFVIKCLEGKSEGALLIYVQKLEEGSNIFFSLNEYARENNLINWSCKSGKAERTFAFINANLASDRKEEILKGVSCGKIKILIATSSVGAGVNLPFHTLLGWGLDPETAGLVQASGRVGRKPMLDRGDVVWVHSTKLGIRIPVESPIRQLLQSPCLRVTMNDWFSHGKDFTGVLPPEDCCSACMEKCIASQNCELCAAKIRQFVPVTYATPESGCIKEVADFLKSLNLDENTPIETPCYDINDLAKSLVKHLLKLKQFDEFQEFLEAFSLGDEITKALHTFLEPIFNELVKKNINASIDSETNTTGDDVTDYDSSDGVSSNTSEDSNDEYFDTD